MGAGGWWGVGGGWGGCIGCVCIGQARNHNHRYCYRYVTDTTMCAGSGFRCSRRVSRRVSHRVSHRVPLCTASTFGCKGRHHVLLLKHTKFNAYTFDGGRGSHTQWCTVPDVYPARLAATCFKSTPPAPALPSTPSSATPSPASASASSLRCA